MTFNPNSDPQELALSSSAGMFISLERYNQLIESENELKAIKRMSEEELATFVILRTYPEFIRERGTNRWFPLSANGIHLALPIESESCPEGKHDRGEFWRDEKYGVLQWDLIRGER